MRPVFGFFQSEASARDQLVPLFPLLNQTAKRDRSNGELKQTTSSPSRMQFQKVLFTNDARLTRVSSVFEGKCSAAAGVGGAFRCFRKTFNSASETSSL